MIHWVAAHRNMRMTRQSDGWVRVRTGWCTPSAFCLESVKWISWHVFGSKKSCSPLSHYHLFSGCCCVFPVSKMTNDHNGWMIQSLTSAFCSEGKFQISFDNLSTHNEGFCQVTDPWEEFQSTSPLLNLNLSFQGFHLRSLGSLLHKVYCTRAFKGPLRRGQLEGVHRLHPGQRSGASALEGL